MSTDLELLLRRTLQDRAATVHTGPQWQPPVRNRRRRNWLAATGAAAAVAAVALVIALLPSAHHRTPAQSGSPSPTSSPSPSPSPTPSVLPVSHAPRKVSLAWFRIKKLPGYTLHEWQSEPGYRQVGIRRDDDSEMPRGCDGCEIVSDFVTVYDRGAFNAQRAGVPAWAPGRVGAAPAYFGTLHNPSGYGDSPAVAWQYRPDSWAVVFGVTDLGNARSTLTAIADAIEPTVSTPIELPFTLGYVPDLPITEVMDDRDQGYSFGITFGNIRTRSLSISLVDQRSLSGVYDLRGTSPRLIDGLPGRYSVTEGAGVIYHDGTATISISEWSGRVTAQDRQDLNILLDHLHWTNGDGRRPYVSAQQAIP